MLRRLTDFLLHPMPLRAMTRAALRRFSLGSYAYRVEHGAVDRPAYGYIIFQAADLARRLGLSAMSVIEFGVAGGRGLLAMEHHAKETERATGVQIQVYGFDRAEGLPDPIGYRDLPHYWQPGSFRMDVEQLRSCLTKAQLVLGDVADTVPAFLAARHAPIGAISFDLDFWSSTAAAMKILESELRLLPRVQCYFDDVTGGPLEAYSRYTGELLAIEEWNAAHERQKFDVAHNLLAQIREFWHPKIRVFHSFDHPAYTRFVSRIGDELAL